MQEIHYERVSDTFKSNGGHITYLNNNLHVEYTGVLGLTAGLDCEKVGPPCTEDGRQHHNAAP